MRKSRQLLVLAVVVVLSLVGAGTASAVGTPQAGVVSETTASQTPYVLDGTVTDLAQVGNRIVVAGTFTQVQDSPANGGAPYDPDYVFAFDPATGRIDRAFDPIVN